MIALALNWRTAIPPKLQLVLIAGAMAAAVPTWPGRDRVSDLLGVCALVLAALALCLLLATAWAMRRAKTTTNPMYPETAQQLLTHGVFSLSRNPMYLADVLLLLAWSVWLGDARLLAGPVLFWASLHWGQIPAEERALVAVFGPDYAAYAGRVRRWLGRCAVG